MLAAAERELENIQATGADAFALDQSTRLINAVATTIYGYFLLRMVWRSYGESCDYCQQLDGREVGATELFLAAGESLLDAVGAALTMSSNVRHAPLHGGCDCQVVAARGGVA